MIFGNAGKLCVLRCQKRIGGITVAKTKKIAKVGGPCKTKAAQKSASCPTGKCGTETGSTTIDRRNNADRRKAADRRLASVPVAVERRKIERREKVNRRRQIDPTTCERDYSAEEIEFMAALDSYKRTSGRMFPTCSEVLEVLLGLGYEKRSPAAATSETVAPEAVAQAAVLPPCDVAVPSAAPVF
jgi:hypothetical protein